MAHLIKNGLLHQASRAGIQQQKASPLRIYLSGSIRKGKSDLRGDESFWTEQNEDELKQRLKGDVLLLNPAKSAIRRNDYFINYGCDLYLVTSSDLVLVDLRMEKGIGVGAELMYAQFIGRPVIGWLPKNSYYRREKVEDVFGEDLLDWTHPFVFGLCDFVAEDLEEACDQIGKMKVDNSFRKSPAKTPEEAIQAFIRAYGTEIGDVGH